MADENNTTESDTGAGHGPSKSKSGADSSDILYSNEIIANHVLQSAILITIQLIDTIIYSTVDQSQGAKRFQALMRLLLGNSSHGKGPVLIWVAHDLGQLRHVVQMCKTEDRALFDQLASNAIYAEAKPTASIYQDLGQIPKKAASGNRYQAITLHPNDDTKQDADRYLIYGHCNPDRKSIGWDNGPICDPVSGFSNVVSLVADQLLLAHQLLISNTINAQTEMSVKNLERSGLYPKRLEILAP